MTTEQAARQYLAEFQGKKYAVYNPHNKPEADLPFIYGFNNGGSRHWYGGVLISADGHVLGEHICSDEGYMRHDLGVLEGTRPDRHEEFQRHYPDGYRMDFVTSENCDAHPGLQEAFRLRRARDTSC